jgi:hypothetical protein
MSVNEKREASIQMDDQKNSVSLASIVIDDRFQTRAAIDHAAIEDYIEAIRVRGRWPFPPIKIVSQFLVDGFHRVTAAKLVAADRGTSAELRRSLQDIPCERVLVDLSSDDVPDLALQHALAANHTHGLKRTNADKRRAIELALKCWPDRSDREIAKLTGTSHPNVGTVRGELKVEILPPESEPESPLDHPLVVEELPLESKPSSLPEGSSGGVETLPPKAKQRASGGSDDQKPNPEELAKKIRSIAIQHRDKLVLAIDDYAQHKPNRMEQDRLVRLVQGVSLW